MRAFRSNESKAQSSTKRQGEPQMNKQGRGSGRVARLAMALVAAIAATAMAAPLAQAAFGVTEFENEVVNRDGTAAVQAAGHPYAVTTRIAFNTTSDRFGFPVPDESVKDIVVDLPAGFAGSTTAMPRCANAQLFEDPTTGVAEDSCPYDTIVGVVGLELPRFIGGFETQYYPLHNMVPPAGVPASFAFNYFNSTVYMNARVRSESDYGITVESPNTNQTVPLVGVTTTFWGVPGDESHDDQRCRAINYSYMPDPGLCTGASSNPEAGSPHRFTLPVKPLLTNVSDCTAGPFTTNLKADSWAHPGAWDFASDTLEEAGSPVGIGGCEHVPFEPTFTLAPERREAGVPTGIEASISIPGSGLENPGGIAQSPLRSAEVTFPPGMTVNASSADGLAGCPEADAKLGTAQPASCPEASKLGAVRIETPLLENPLEGSVYLATQGTNPFKSLLALYISVADPTTGIVLKIPGKVSPDPRTGQLTASFQDTPQLPFSRFAMRLKGGNRAALVTPSACGTYTTQATLAGWANPGDPVSSPSSFTIDRGCGEGARFTPGFQAGSENPVAGDHTAFALRVTRPDGQQNVKSIEASLPEGLLAKLAGVPLCPQAAAGSGECPAASQVGSATVGAGAGTSPIYVPQPGKAPTAVYLAGPYKGAPYSLVAKVPAQAGPFDLGTVAVRNALEVDPVSAQVTAKSDPLPQILQGIPIAYRDIRVDVDRQGFVLNPTSCEPMQVKGTIGSEDGARASVSDRFQVSGCRALAFKPHLKIRVKGATKRGKYPKLRAVLRAKPGQANIGKVSVALPHSEFLAQEHIRTICTRVQYAAKACPKGSVYGYARAFTPLLDKPLQGPVYLRSSDNPLPDLVASLQGQIHIDLAGRIDSVRGGIRTTFEGVPDAPVTRFVLNMKGGKKSLLVNSRNLCKTKNRATVKMDGQNGKAHDFRPLVKNSCGKKAKKRGARHRAR